MSNMTLQPSNRQGRDAMYSLRAQIILSVNRALLGEVFPALVGVACQPDGITAFELVFFVDTPSVEDWREDISCIETEVIADFPADMVITHRIVASAQAAVSGDGFLIFLRKRQP